MPRRATPPKPAEDDKREPELPAVVSAPARKRSAPAPLPESAAKRPAPVRKKPAAVTKAAKPLIVDPEVPAVAAPARRTARISPAGALPPAVIPREALLSPRHDRLLGAAIAISVLIHLVILTIHFRPFDLASRSAKGPPLEVALVNAKTVAKPAQADILAQANLDGGGNTDANRRARTPLPVLPKHAPDQQIAVATQKVEALEKQTRELLTQLRNAPAPLSMQAPTDANEKTDLPSANELMQKTLEAMRLEAQIAKDMEAYQKRPKRRFIGARAEEYRFARYVEDWRLKIERIGNLNYPEAARQQKLYGNLILTVSIKSDGSVESVEINRTSGNRILDAAAIRIVEMSGPFAPFPPDIKRDTDILAITRTWKFTKADQLESQ
ncbi:MAG: TonB family protein [Burkholderiales bacterium]|nr:TonB family protein [Burkholderiales bacterium]